MDDQGKIYHQSKGLGPLHPLFHIDISIHLFKTDLKQIILVIKALHQTNLSKKSWHFPNTKAIGLVISMALLNI